MTSLLHINIRGLRANRTLLTQYTEDTTPDLILINETKMPETVPAVNIPGYYIATCNPAVGLAGGTIIYAKMGISTCPIDTSHIQNDCCAITINHPTMGKTAIVSAYIPPLGKINENLFTFFLDKYNKCIFLGDFNAHHLCISSTCTKPNNIGKQIDDIITSHPLIIGNKDGPPTRYNSASGTNSLLDLAIVSTNIFHHLDNYCIGEDVGSDHLPLHLNFSDPLLQSPTILKRNINKADWSKFSALTLQSFNSLRDLSIQPPKNLQEIDELVLAISDNLLTALDQVAPLKPCTNRPFTLTEPTIQLIKEKRKLRRQLQRNPNASSTKRLQSIIQKGSKNC